MPARKKIEEAKPIEGDTLPEVPAEALPVEPEAEEIVAPENPAEAPKSGKDSVVVVIEHGVPHGPATGYVRTFSKADHGADFKDQARAYAEKFGGTFN